MIKTILVPWTGSESDREAFQSAIRAARSFAAHLEFLHVRIDPVEIAAAMTTADVGAALVTSDWIDRLEAEAEERARKARQTFEEYAAAEQVALDRPAEGVHALTASYHVETGSEGEWVADYARTADLLVAARPAETGGAARDTIESALLQSGRPVLVAGPAPLRAPLSRVAIAWKPTREAARAVDGALPFLSMAKRISIIAVAEDEHPDETSAARLRGNLVRHGLEVDLHTPDKGSDAGATLLDTAGAIGADLLVMGGYGHSRFREFVFGGFTERALRGAGLPVLMAH
jgi:nucleotide-binding universal stress UspA family protein